MAAAGGPVRAFLGNRVERAAVTVSDDVWLVTFRAGGQACALPLDAVDRVVPMVALVPVGRVSPMVLGLIDVHGAPVPVFDLTRRLQVESSAYGIAARLLIGRTTRRRYAVAAHAVDGAARVPAGRMASITALLPGAGMLPAVLAGEGGLIFVHDPETFLTLDEQRELDDAITVRT